MPNGQSNTLLGNNNNPNNNQNQRNINGDGNNTLSASTTTITQRQNTQSYLKFLSKPSLNNFSTSFLNAKQAQYQCNNLSASTYQSILKFDKSNSNLTIGNSNNENGKI
jgi:hypothetical protein